MVKSDSMDAQRTVAETARLEAMKWNGLVLKYSSGRSIMGNYMSVVDIPSLISPSS